MKNWDCSILTEANHELRDKVFTPESSVVQAGSFTVGQKLQLQCKGEPITDRQGEWATTFIADKEEKPPSYFIEKPEFIDETTLNLNIASYKVGEQSPSFLIAKGEEKITAKVKSFEVMSILEKHDFKVEVKQSEQQQPGQGPQPYPFLGPNKLGYPVLLWIILLSVLVLGLLYGLRKWFKYYKLKRWQEDLSEHQLATTPEKFFYKELRGIQRQKLDAEESYKQLQNAYYTFLEHKFTFPVRERSINESTKYIMVKNKIPKTSLVRMKRNLLELKKVGSTSKSLELHDIEKIGESLRKNVDEFADMNKGKQIR
jgi:hypothetical protein